MSEATIKLAPAKARFGLLLSEDEAMARNRSTQRGRIVPKGDRLTLRYCVRDQDKKTGWKDCREFLPVGTTPQEAEAFRAKRIEVINKLNNSRLVNPVITLDQFTKSLWVDYQKERGMEESTIYSYDSMLNSLVLPSLGSLRIDRITPQHLTRLMKAAREKPYSSKYRLNLYSMLKIIFDVARDYDLVSQNPVRAKLHRPVHERTEKTRFTPDQLRALTQQIPEDYRLLFFTAGVLGLRVGEVLPLQWGDIKDGIVSLNRGIWRGRIKLRLKTKGSRRPMPLGEILAERLEAHRVASDWGREDDFVFCRPDGRPLDSDHVRRVILYPALKAAGIPIVARESGVHALRHSAGSILWEMTRDLEMVKRFMRHTRISTTSDIYVHPSEAVALEAVDAMASVYFVEGVQ
jgi:integrase